MKDLEFISMMTAIFFVNDLNCIGSVRTYTLIKNKIQAARIKKIRLIPDNIRTYVRKHVGLLVSSHARGFPWKDMLFSLIKSGTLKVINI